MSATLGFLVSGLFLGLTAGTAPGPLLTLVLSETLKHGKKEGVKIAVCPLITDLPIVLLAFLVLTRLEGHNWIIGVISIFGACYLVYLGLRNLTVGIEAYETNHVKQGVLRRGIIANFLSPYPYLFWLSIGGPMISKSLDMHMSATILFILGFYIMLVVSKIGVAVVAEESKSLIRRKYHLHIVRVLGLALILFALSFAKDGLELVGLL